VAVIILNKANSSVQAIISVRINEAPLHEELVGIRSAKSKDLALLTKNLSSEQKLF